VSDAAMPFLKHLDEFRKRLIRAFIGIAVGFAACWHWGDQIRDFLVAPLLAMLPEGEKHLTALKITEPFIIKLKLCFYAGLFVASPVVLYQFWAFISPALYQKERRSIGIITIFSVFLFVAGLAFGYWVFLPLCFKFFVAFIGGYLTQNYALSEYVSFTVSSLLAFGLVFQTPLVLLILNFMGLVNTRFLRKFRKYAFLIAFIIGAILTPTPDAFNQIVMSVPIYLFYELSIILIALFGRKKKTDEEQAAAPESSQTPAG
jgi:sec-independent protein translocase protein TatC